MGWRHFGTTPEFWLNAQAVHAPSRAKSELDARIGAEVTPRAA
jgi:plasmid maintenance system antidote protein VapI